MEVAVRSIPKLSGVRFGPIPRKDLRLRGAGRPGVGGGGRQAPAEAGFRCWSFLAGAFSALAPLSGSLPPHATPPSPFWVPEVEKPWDLRRSHALDKTAACPLALSWGDIIPLGVGKAAPSQSRPSGYSGSHPRRPPGFPHSLPFVLVLVRLAAVSSPSLSAPLGMRMGRRVPRLPFPSPFLPL